MAAAVKFLANRMEEMENSFLSIFFEAANKIADSTESKLFFMMESSDGIRKIGGCQELRELFQIGALLPQNSDVIMGEGSSSKETQPNENYVALNISDRAPKRKNPTQEMSLVVSKKRKKTQDFSVKEEECLEGDGMFEEEDDEEEEEDELGGLSFGLHDHENVVDTTSEGADADDDHSLITKPRATKEG